MQPAPSSSYGRILKTSALLGGSSLIGMGLGILRTKVLAVQLGPGLFGTMGLYTVLVGIVGLVAGLGLSQSAVREIAAAAGKEDADEVAHTIKAFRRVVWLTGACGAILMLAVAWPGSMWTFGDHEHALPLAFLSLMVLTGHLAMGQVALLQGLRRVREMAALAIFGAALSTALGIPILLALREDGIVPFMLAVSCGTLVMGWWFVRRVAIPVVRQSWAETWRRSRRMLALGVTFMAAALVVAAADYLVRLILVRADGVGEEGVGLYMAAFTLSSMFVSFVLTAMSADYYPRLTASVHDRDRTNLLVNEQADVALLLGVPGLVATLVLADWVIWAFYSAKFVGASEILRWMVLGLFGRLLSWPLGFIMQAKADKRAFFWSELVTFALQVLLVAILVRPFGVVGAGMAFAGMYFWYVPLIAVLSRRLYGFTWRGETVVLVLTSSALVTAAFLSTFLPSPAGRYGIGGATVAVACGVSIGFAYRRLGRARIARAMAQLLGRVGIAASSRSPNPDAAE